MNKPRPPAGDPGGPRRRLELLADVEPLIQSVPATGDRDVAVLWYDILREQGIEGILWSGFDTA
ncbi:hypothetical protein [Streptomyces sp. NPDC002403]